MRRDIFSPTFFHLQNILDISKSINTERNFRPADSILFCIKLKISKVRPGSWPPRLPGLAQCRPEPRDGGGAGQSEAEDPGLGQSELRAARGHPGPGQQQQHHHDIRLRRGQGRAGPRLSSPKCLWRLDTSPEQAAPPGHHPPAPLRIRWAVPLPPHSSVRTHYYRFSVRGHRDQGKDVVTAVTHHDINGMNSVSTVAVKDVDVQMTSLSGYETYV